MTPRWRRLRVSPSTVCECRVCQTKPRRRRCGRVAGRARRGSPPKVVAALCCWCLGAPAASGGAHFPPDAEVHVRWGVSPRWPCLLASPAPRGRWGADAPPLPPRWAWTRGRGRPRFARPPPPLLFFVALCRGVAPVAARGARARRVEEEGREAALRSTSARRPALERVWTARPWGG